MREFALTPTEIVVVGAGMVAHRFVESLLSRAESPLHVTVIGDEGRHPYDRRRLTDFISGSSAEDLELDRSVLDDFRVRLLADDRVLRIDRARRTVTTRSRTVVPYDTLVLATGSYAAKLAVDGADLPGCFLYRTLDDAQQLKDFVDWRRVALGRRLRGAVIGGGPLGLEAAGALQGMDIDATVVPYSGRLLSDPLDSANGGKHEGLLERRGIAVRAESRTTRIDPDDSGAVAALEFQDGSVERADVVVFTLGVRPRDELARNAGLQVAPRGGVVIDDRCSTSDPLILAIGEVANFDGRCVGLVASGYAMAEVAATRLLGGDAVFRGYDESSTLMLSGVEDDVDVARFGDAIAYGALRPLVGATHSAEPAAQLLPLGGSEARARFPRRVTAMVAESRT
ncbi:NAD(P)/FAD-dependent oxidoreductase [Microbacterium sp. C5A9]|uniref:FAD-dependent oxidoreductase n=1 Tax=Microbacterium sp. C5A9 TaxID=2736663 RepID=UPI001F51E79D|nr:FAD-dependent oxidoreductase [Microbacterium sp. C5A9]MCI1018155.1 NAD(P)/FAD-dependent oxidoreductase [Microbacterium sp. C5A9]